MIIPVFTPHGGCPERCRFCDQRVSGGSAVSAAQVTATIEEFLKTSPFYAEVAFYGGTFTALPEHLQKAYLGAVEPFIEAGRVGSVRISTRPDAIVEPWLRELRDRYHLRTVEIGAQSCNPEVLRALGRSHTVADVEAAAGVLKRLGLNLGIHLMIGCPGEQAGAKAEDEATVRWVLGLKPWGVRIHPLLVLKNTDLTQTWESGAFQPLSLEAAVERVALLTAAFEQAGISVIRLGLQANELLGNSIEDEGGAVLAGPYHPAFGDLVRGRMLRNEMEARFLGLKLAPGAAITLEADERVAGPLKGPGKVNLEWLTNRFALSALEVRVVRHPEPQGRNETNERVDLPIQVKVRLCDPAGVAQRR